MGGDTSLKVTPPKGPNSPIKLRNPNMPENSPPPPPAPAAPKIDRELVKKLEKEKESKEKSDIFKKLNLYFENPKLAQYIPEHMEKPSPKDSLETLKAMHESIQSTMRHAYKSSMIHTFIDQGFHLTEAALVNFAQMNEKRGLGIFMSQNKEAIFGPDLDLLIIETSDDWVPDAKVRVLLKFLQVAMAFNSSVHFSNIPKEEKEEEEENSKEEKEEKENGSSNSGGGGGSARGNSSPSAATPKGQNARGPKKFPKKAHH